MSNHTVSAINEFELKSIFANIQYVEVCAAEQGDLIVDTAEQPMYERTPSGLAESIETMGIDVIESHLDSQAENSFLTRQGIAIDPQFESGYSLD